MLLYISKPGMRNSLLALILPGALPAFNLVLMINFFRQISREMEEASLIDGAGYFSTLVKIYIPCSMAAIATISLFCMVGHWNSWFDGLIYMTSADMKPLQTYLRMVIIQLDVSKATMNDVEILRLLSDRGLRAAQVIIAILPILAVYPFLQRYFVKGLVLGSVKG
jgi:putative aldouronate transport system permease protein